MTDPSPLFFQFDDTNARMKLYEVRSGTYVNIDAQQRDRASRENNAGASAYEWKGSLIQWLKWIFTGGSLTHFTVEIEKSGQKVQYVFNENSAKNYLARVKDKLPNTLHLSIPEQENLIKNMKRKTISLLFQNIINQTICLPKAPPISQPSHARTSGSSSITATPLPPPPSSHNRRSVQAAAPNLLRTVNEPASQRHTRPTPASDMDFPEEPSTPESPIDGEEWDTSAARDIWDNVENNVENAENTSSDTLPKKIPLTKKLALQKLTQVLSTTHETYGHAIDNGDCFYDAIAQRLTAALGRADNPVTTKELRRVVADEVERLHRENPNDNWVYRQLKLQNVAGNPDYDELRRLGGIPADELSADDVPLWGRLTIEGRIIAEHYKAKIQLCEIIVLDNTSIPASEFQGLEQEYEGEHFDDFRPIEGGTRIQLLKVCNPNWIEENPVTSSPQHTIRIAVYPGHFVPINPV